MTEVRDRERVRLQYNATLDALASSQLPEALGCRDLQQAVSQAAETPAACAAAADSLLRAMESRLRSTAYPSSYGGTLRYHFRPPSHSPWMSLDPCGLGLRV